MKLFRRLGLPIVLAVSACGRDKRAAGADTAAQAAAPAGDTVAAPPRAQSWDPSAGPLLLVAAESASRAFVVVPDSLGSAAVLANLPRPADATLFSRSGSVQSAELVSPGDSGSCTAVALRAAPPPRPWNIGFIGGVVSPLSLDSLEGMTHADSGALVAAAARLASSLPNDSAGRFTGLPFVVRALWRFTIGGGNVVIAANLSRQINQEATPLQERTLILAERPPSDSAFAMAYHERSYGDEETVESRDLLAAVLLGSAKSPAIILSRDFGDATAYALIERAADGRWHARWTSARRRC